VLGGDITGKVLVPIVEERPGHFVASMFGRTERIKHGRDLDALEKRIRFNGFYPYRCSPSEFDRLSGDAAWRDRVISEVMLKEVGRWMTIADEKLSRSSVRCLVMAGNDDPWEIDKAIGSETVENPDGSVIEVGGYQLLSSSWANPTPWDSPREAPESRLWELYEELGSQLDPAVQTIFNLHAPPFDSGHDSAPALDASLAVKRIGGQAALIPVGSHAVRSFIEGRRPILGLHGHIHESRFVTRLGATICINPGSTYSDGVIDGALVELEEGAVARYQLVSG